MTDTTEIPPNTPTALVRVEAADDGTVTGRWKYAQALSKAGDVIPKALWAPVRNQDGTMGPPAPSPGKIMAVTEVARMLGMHPLAGLMGVYVIEGRPTLSAAIMSAKIRTSGHLLRVGTRGALGDLSLVGWATLIRKDDPEFEYRVEWTIDDAVQAGLGEIKAGKWHSTKDNWRKYPRAMLKARAIAEVIREAAEDELMGAAYLPDELGANTNENGEPVDAPMSAPTRDWAADIASVHTHADAQVLAEQLRVAPDYDVRWWSMLMTRIGTLQSDEDVYGPNGEPIEPDVEHEPDEPSVEHDEATGEVVVEPEPEAAPVVEPEGDDVDAEVLAEFPDLPADQRAGVAAVRRKARAQSGQGGAQ
jgi:hypothetical protein